MLGDRNDVGFACGEGGVCKLFAGGDSTSATSVLLRRKYPLTVRGYLFTFDVGAWRLPSRTNFHAYHASLENQLPCDPSGSLQLGALQAIPLALWPKTTL